MLSPGDVVERYEVERELGGGGMARVYKVHHVALGSVHALKVLDPELVNNAELRARFLDEGRIQARLKHPNILGITDVVAAPGVAGLVMDYLAGESLGEYLARIQHPPTPDEVRDIFRQVLEGMGFAHAQGVIHRDLKPSNIFLEQTHGRRVVRLLDFGIAKVTGPEARPTTRTGVRMGTPQYMSPEQIRGARDVTVRSDIFSLGVTLYELATGQPCYQGESDFNIMEKVVRAEFVPPEVAYPGLERALGAIIRRAMDVDPDKRFASCQEMADALVHGGLETPAAASPPLIPSTPLAPSAPLVESPVARPAAVEWGSVSPKIPRASASREVPVAEPRPAETPVEAKPEASEPPRPAPGIEARPVPVARPPVVEAREAPVEARPVPVAPRPAPVVVRPAPEVPRPAPRVVAVRPEPVAPVKVAEPRPAAVLEKSRPSGVRERPLPVKHPEAPARKAAPSSGRAWPWVLLFVFLGVMVLYLSALIGLLRTRH